MALVAVSRQIGLSRNEELRDLIGNEKNFTRWVEHPTSNILHHDDDCCEEARMWFLAYAYSMEASSLSQFKINAPSWLSELFTWGRSEWPISWCQLVKEKTLDCGVFAALAREVFQAQGVEAHPAQALLLYNSDCTDHWKDMWKSQAPEKPRNEIQVRDVFPWIGDKVVYHELCVLEHSDGSASVYDSTWGIWHEPYPRKGFGSLLALRTECPRLLRWGDKLISHGEWINL